MIYSSILLTQDSGIILGPIAKLLGYIMNALYNFLDNFGITSIILCIILFTIIVNVLMIPLTFKQQKFSRLSAQMNPELQAIQKKYKGKNDQASMKAMQDEQNAIYEKYGTTPTGGCIQLVITLPILFGLYRVIYSVPAYVQNVKNAFIPLVDKITGISGYKDLITDFVDAEKLSRIKLNFDSADATTNSIIDVLNNCTSSGWDNLKDVFPTLTDSIDSVHNSTAGLYNFFGLNIADNPLSIIKNSFSSGEYLLVALAILVPVVAALVTFLSSKLMPQQQNNDNATLNNSMKTMNLIMPFMQAFFCLTFNVGVGIYIITGSLVRILIQLGCNRVLKDLDIDIIIEKNKERAEKKREKRGVTAKQITNNANINTRSISDKAKVVKSANDEAYTQVEAKPGSMREKANMVRTFNERNNRQ